MSVVGVIPARWGSTRFPGKSIAPVCGKPLIGWVIERCHAAARLSQVLVATDDDRIARVAEEFGALAVMTGPDHPSGTDRVAEAVAGIEADSVVNIQGDEPMIEPALIDRLAETICGEGDWDMVTAATPVVCAEDVTNSTIVKVVWDNAHRALYFSRAGIPFVRDGDEHGEGTVCHWRHVGIYAYSKSFLEKLVGTDPCALEQAEKLEQLRALHIGGKILVLETDNDGIGVDTPGDVARVETLLKRDGAK